MSRTLPTQFEIMVDYMERNGDLLHPYQRVSGRTILEKKWQELTQMLNADANGVERDVNGWKKVWSDYKAKIKKKKTAIGRVMGGTGGRPTMSKRLSKLEKRVLVVMGHVKVERVQTMPEERMVVPSPSPEPTNVTPSTDVDIFTEDIKWPIPVIPVASTSGNDHTAISPITSPRRPNNTQQGELKASPRISGNTQLGELRASPTRSRNTQLGQLRVPPRRQRIPRQAFTATTEQRSSHYFKRAIMNFARNEERRSRMQGAHNQQIINLLRENAASMREILVNMGEVMNRLLAMEERRMGNGT